MLHKDFRNCAHNTSASGPADGAISSPSGQKPGDRLARRRQIKLPRRIAPKYIFNPISSQPNNLGSVLH